MYALVLTLFAFLSPATFFILYRFFSDMKNRSKEAKTMFYLFIFTALGNALALGLFVYRGELYIGAGIIAGVAGLAAIVLGIFTLTRKA